MKHQSGNALFLILIAVALFAALSYAITSSSRGSGNMDKERVILLKSDFENYLSDIQAAVIRLQVINGCSDTQISFENSISPQDYTNLNAPFDNRCHIFEPEGGGLTFRMFGEDFMEDPNDVANARIRFTARPISGIGEETESDLLLLFTDIVPEICYLLNIDRGINTPAGTPAAENYSRAVFDGTYSTETPDISHVQHAGELSFCLTKATNVHHDFFHVLIAR